jgi:hypothetical protein
MVSIKTRKNDFKRIPGLAWGAIVAVLGTLPGGCLVDFGVPMTDASRDTQPDDTARDEQAVDEWSEDGTQPDEHGEIEPPPGCGDGIVGPDEECDQADPAPCTTPCGTEGIRTCDACFWSACAPPAEICDEIDQNCDGVADEWLWTLRGQPFLVNAGGGPSLAPSAAWSGSMFSILWEDARTGEWQIFLSGIGADYSVVVPEVRITASENGAHSPSAAWNGAGLGAAWIGRPGFTGDRDAYAALFAADGSPLSSPLDVSESKTGDERDVGLVWTGTGYGAAWTAADGVYLSIISAAIDSVSTRRMENSSGAGAVCIAWSGSRFGIFWQDDAGGSPDIMGRLAESDGSIASDTLALTTDPSDQASPACAFGDVFKVMWQDNRSGAGSILGSSILADGTILAGEFLVTGCSGICTEPALAWTGDSYVLAVVDEQAESRSLFMRRMNIDGAPLGDDLDVIQPGVEAARPALAWNGSLVAAAFEGAEGSSRNIYMIVAGCP